MPPSRAVGKGASKNKTGLRSQAQDVLCPVCQHEYKANALASYMRVHDESDGVEELLGGTFVPTALERQYGIAGPGPSSERSEQQLHSAHNPIGVPRLSQPTAVEDEGSEWTPLNEGLGITAVQEAQDDEGASTSDPDMTSRSNLIHALNSPPAISPTTPIQHLFPASNPLGFQDRYRDRKPWAPYVKRLDFELSEWMRLTGLNRKQIDSLLTIVHQICKMPKEVTLVDSQHILEMWDISAEHCNIGLKRTQFKANYRDEEMQYTVWGSDLWEAWALKLLKDPVHIRAMQWDAIRTFRHNSRHWERFINEPWTANAWWELQSEVPSGASLFCILVYADATKLLTMGTAKGHPVYARCLNLPCEMRNGEESAGGHLIGFLPAVPEDADKAGKKHFIDFKHVVWHETFKIFLKKMMEYEKTGTQVRCGNGILRLILPVILILCADYEERCIMAAIRRGKINYPCPHCLVPVKDMWKVVSTVHEPRTVENMRATYNKALTQNSADAEETLKGKGLRKVFNVFWNFLYTRVYAAISWDHLHAYHSGLFSDHLFEEILKILEQKNVNKCCYHATVEAQLSAFPSWR
ncbi:hypothetical protein BKA70DRAFT_1447131 [Coprinopsis sp. MPI-PUGE-AT-0042]|nr:hypothetical protein BKA70DRAFT_1447131 [Coprinopsis sp. MPI-PUGE-AT-0042]